MTTYVLVHGGGTTGRFWDRTVAVLDRLDPHGRALAFDLPGRGEHPADLGTVTVEDEVASVVADVRAAAPDGPVVLVAHSSGGLVVPGVAEALAPQVRAIVLVAALVPPEGGDGVDCMQPRHAAGLRAAAASLGPDDPPITLPGPPEDPEPFRSSTGGEPLDDDTLAFVVDPVRSVPDGVHHYFQPVRWSQVGPEVPVTYLLTLHDRPIPADLQREMVERLPRPARVVELPAGHLAPITHPDPVTEHVVGAVHG